MKFATRRAIGGVKQNSVSAVWYLPLRGWSGRSQDLKTIQVTAFTLEFPAESDGKNLLIKTPYTLVIGHRNMLAPTRKLPVLCLTFTVLVSATQAAEEVLCDWGFDQRTIPMGRTPALLFGRNLVIKTLITSAWPQDPRPSYALPFSYFIHWL